MSSRLVWPPLMRPRVPLVYLDLNHLVSMAKVVSGHRSALPAYQRLLDAAMSASVEGRAVFPLSASHVWEILKIEDPRQRKTLVGVVEPLSRFAYLLDRVTLAELEIEAGMNAVTGEGSDDYLPLLRSTIGHAFGVVGGLWVRDSAGRDVTDEVRRAVDPGEFDARLAGANLLFERQVLQGPDDEQVAVLRAEYGFRPETARASHESRVGFERETARLLDENPRWRRGRLRDVIGAREVVHEWLDVFTRLRLSREQEGRVPFSPTDAQMRAFLGAMPHVQVAISIKTRYHSNPRMVWTANHITDIDAMSVAYAYCDAVLTDKEVRNALAVSRELAPMGAYLPRTPVELADWLDAIPAVPAADALVPVQWRPVARCTTQRA